MINYQAKARLPIKDSTLFATGKKMQWKADKWAIMALLCASMALIPRTASYSEEMDLPVSQQFGLFMKILTYDKHLKEFPGNEVVFAIVYQSGYKTSQNTQSELFNIISESKIDKLGNKNLKFITIDLSRYSDFSLAVNDNNIGIIYVAPLRAYSIDNITSISRSRSIISMTGVPNYVEAGLAVGVSNRGGKPQILINLKAARAEGANFGSQLLKLARVIE